MFFLGYTVHLVYMWQMGATIVTMNDQWMQAPGTVHLAVCLAQCGILV